MRSMGSIRSAWIVGVLAFSAMVLAFPGSALAQFYEYSMTATVTQVQAVDAAGTAVTGYDYTKFTDAGITVGAAATSFITLDSATPDTTDPPDATQGSYMGAYTSFSVGSVSFGGFTINNGVAVMNDRPGGADTIPLAHDIFAWGGTRPNYRLAPNWLDMNDGTRTDRKGFAVVLIEWNTTNALSSTALPTTLNLASFNFMKQFSINFYDLATGQRVDVTATVDTVAVDTNAANPPPVSTLGRWAVALLATLLLGLGAAFAGAARPSRA